MLAIPHVKPAPIVDQRPHRDHGSLLLNHPRHPAQTAAPPAGASHARNRLLIQALRAIEREGDAVVAAAFVKGGQAVRAGFLQQQLTGR